MLQDISAVLHEEYTPSSEYVLKEKTKASPSLELEKTVSQELWTSQVAD